MQVTKWQPNAIALHSLMKFTEFGFDDRLMDGIEGFGLWRSPTPVQEEQVIPIGVAEERCDRIGTSGCQAKQPHSCRRWSTRMLSEPHNAHSINAPRRHRHGVGHTDRTKPGRPGLVVLRWASLHQAVWRRGGRMRMFRREKGPWAWGLILPFAHPVKWCLILKWEVCQTQYLENWTNDRTWTDDKHGMEWKCLDWDHRPQPAEINTAISKPPEKDHSTGVLGFDAQKTLLILVPCCGQTVNVVVVLQQQIPQRETADPRIENGAGCRGRDTQRSGTQAKREECWWFSQRTLIDTGGHGDP